MHFESGLAKDQYTRPGWIEQRADGETELNNARKNAEQMAKSDGVKCCDSVQISEYRAGLGPKPKVHPPIIQELNI